MAKISFKNQSEYYQKLQELETLAAKDETLEKAVVAGAKVVADKIRSNLESLPTEKFRYLPEGERRNGLTPQELRDLSASFGLAPIQRENGYVNTKAGFDGYGSHPTKTYPHGVPNAMIARAAESGSSMRNKKPFVRPAVNASRQKAIKEMEEVIDDEMKKIFGG